MRVYAVSASDCTTEEAHDRRLGMGDALLPYLASRDTDRGLRPDRRLTMYIACNANSPKGTEALMTTGSGQ